MATKKAAEAAEEKPARTVFEINGKRADLAAALPFTIGDWKAIKKATGVDVMKMGSAGLGVDEVSGMVAHAFAKANPEITTEDVDGLALPDILEAMQAINGRANEADPTS